MKTLEKLKLVSTGRQERDFYQRLRKRDRRKLEQAAARQKRARKRKKLKLPLTFYYKQKKDKTAKMVSSHGREWIFSPTMRAKYCVYVYLGGQMNKVKCGIHSVVSAGGLMQDDDKIPVTWVRFNDDRTSWFGLVDNTPCGGTE